MNHGRRIAVVGLGYVGLPAAAAFARHAHVIAFDVDRGRIDELKAGRDHTGSVSPSELAKLRLHLTSDPADLRHADFYIVCVPTPIDAARRPDLQPLFAASHIVGRALKCRDIVVYESTVYPGVTEEECAPILEQASGLACGTDFTVGYSPERINPGDPEHRFETITKVVAGQDQKTLDIIAAVYGAVVTAGVFRAPDIKTAEAAKVIENTQRDVNIAFMNELSAIFHLIGVDTNDVLEAARTKWNFLDFTPGLVGGHCIGVDPYYLTYCAERAGYHPEVLLAGRRLNDTVGFRVARQCIRMMMRRNGGKGLVTILGLTFKENIPDIRNSKVIDIVTELRAFRIPIQIHDPVAIAQDVKATYGITMCSRHALEPADALIFAVPHRTFDEEGWPLMTSLLKNGTGVVLDVKGKLPRSNVPKGIDLWRL